jgi:phospholipase/carboxylesterase
VPDELDHIHRFEAGSDATTLLLLHGTGGDENDLIPLGRMLHPTASLLSPRGKVLEGGMPRFFRRLGMGVFDVEDLKARAADLLAFVDDAAALYGFARDKVVAVGYSNGANIAAGMLLGADRPFAGAALLHAMTPFEVDAPPDLSGVKVLLTGGRRYQMMPAISTEHLGDLLRSAGADLSLHWEPGGHELTQTEVDVVKGWTEKLALTR